MKTRKHIVKISYGLIAVLVIVLAGILFYQQRQIRQMSQNEEGQAPYKEQATLAAVTPSPINTQTASAAEGGAEQLAAEVDNLRYQLEASEEELNMAREDLADKQGGLGDISELMAMEKKMRENPTLMNMRRREMANMIDREYGALFEKLGLSDEKIEAFKTLMVDHQMQEQEVSLSMMDQSLPEEEKKEIMQQIGDLNAQFNKQVSDLLGADEYEAYEAYEERTQERMYISGVFETLGADLGLSDEEAQTLIDAMYDARKGVEAEYDFDPYDVDGMGVNSGMDRQMAILDGYVEGARSVLSESQVAVFSTRMNEQKELMKMNSTFMVSGEDES